MTPIIEVRIKLRREIIPSSESRDSRPDLNSVRAEELGGSGRRAAVSRARAGVAYLWLEWLEPVMNF